MQAGSDRKGPSALGWLLILNIGIFLTDHLLGVFFPRSPASSFFIDWFALTGEGFRSGRIWTIVTYSFLHGGLLHIAFNMLITYGIGRSLQAELGERQFLYLYFGGVLVGGLAGFIFNFANNVVIVGASGGVMALITVYCLQRWEMPVSLLFIEITFRLKWIFFFILGMSLFQFLFDELAGGRSGIAHSTHLGGALIGFLFYKYLMDNTFTTEGFPRTETEMPRWFKQMRKPAATAAKPRRQSFSSPLQMDRKGLQAEVDRILDKINAQGFGSLSEEEKKTLDRARDILSK